MNEVDHLITLFCFGYQYPYLRSPSADRYGLVAPYMLSLVILVSLTFPFFSLLPYFPFPSVPCLLFSLSPFDFFFEIFGITCVVLTWTENYGDATVDVSGTFTNAISALQSGTSLHPFLTLLIFVS